MPRLTSPQRRPVSSETRNPVCTLTAAAATADVTVEVLLAALDSSPEKQELLVEAFEAARTATLEAKQTALSAALASGAGADASAGGITRELMIVRAIADLDSPHIRLLYTVRSPAPGDPVRAWTLRELCFELPELADLVEPMLVVLERHALVESHANGISQLSSNPIDREWTVTIHGERLVERLEGVPAGDGEISEPIPQG